MSQFYEFFYDHVSLPERYRWVRSQAGTRTKLESVTLEQFRASNNFNLVDVFKILSIDSSSTNGCVKELKLFIMQATLSSSKCGNPGEAICSLSETGVSDTWLLVIRSIRSFWHPSCSFSMWIWPVAVKVRTFDKSNTSKFGQWFCEWYDKHGKLVNDVKNLMIYKYSDNDYDNDDEPEILWKFLIAVSLLIGIKS